MPAEGLVDFTPEEYRRRLDGLRQRMARGRFDAVLLTTEANHRYFTGHASHRWMHKYTAIFALLPLEGDPVLIVPPLEAGMCEEDSWIENIRIYPPARIRAGIDAITEATRALGLKRATIGMELGGVLWMRMPFEDFGLLQQNLPDVDFVDASSALWELRARKSPAEMEYIRRAVAITDGAFEAFLDQIRTGMTENEAHRLLAVEHLTRGAESPGSITLSAHTPGEVRSCDRGLRRHTDRVLIEGELIAHDAGGVYHGYWSDYCRTFALGHAAPHHADAYRVVYACMQAAIEVIRPGVPIADLVRASNEVMAASGHAEHAARVSSIGHAMGLDIIEPPFIALEDETLLAEGMVLTVEPSLYAHDAYIMLEEDVLVTDTGYEVLSKPASPELPVL